MPRNKSASRCGKRPPQPRIRIRPSESGSMPTPKAVRASSIRSVSSDWSSERIVQPLSDKAASSRVRLLMLFEPGSAMEEGFRRRGSRRMESVMIFILEDRGKSCYSRLAQHYTRRGVAVESRIRQR